jgi:hypothetical protein
MTVEMGSVGKYGIRNVVQKGSLSWSVLCIVPMPQQGIRINTTIEERRAARDAVAQRIVDALNAFETHKINEDI